MKSTSGRFLVCLLWIACASLHAQEFRALISGMVQDPTGSAIPGALVSIKNVGTNLIANVQSGPDGTYFIPQLPVGTYQLTVEAKGFKKYTREGVTLNLGDKAMVNIRMEIGAATESVTVTAELTGVESNQSVTGQTLASKQLVEVPYGGRNFINFLQMSAGVLGQDSLSQSATSAGPNGNGRDMDFKIQGGRSNSNLFTMDGASSGLNGGASYIPLMDAIQEMKVSTPTSDASYGLSGGGVVSLSMKSGANQVHGVLNEFFQNNILDAWSTQQKVAFIQNPSLKYRKKRDNVFSGMLSGRVVKNKLFYSGNFEGQRTAAASSTNVTVPTDLQRAGDFSQTFNSQAQLMVIYDPLSTVQTGNSFTRTPYLNNKIPSTLFNKISQNLIAMAPHANYVSLNNPITNVNNYFIGNNPNSVSFINNYAKGDYIWSERNRTSATWSRSQRTGYSATSNGILRPNPLIEVNGDPIQRQHQGAILDNVTTINPSTVLTVRAGWDYWVEKVFGTTQFNYDGTRLGFTGPTGLQGIAIPKIAFSSYSSWGNSQDDLRPKEDYELSADLSKTVNRHFLKIGVRAAQIREAYEIRSNFLGSVSFTPGFTQRNPQQSDATSGNDFASFLLGYPSGGNVNNNELLAFKMNQVGLYIQDDFKVTSRLMLNLGFRWDLQTPQTERYNRMNIGFDPNSTYPLGNATAKGSLLFAGSGHRTPFDAHYRDFQPRFGIAYSLSNKLVFRGGFGRSFLPMAAYRSGTGIEDPGLTAGYSVSTPYVATSGGGANLYIPNLPGNSTFANPFPNGFLQPLGAALGPSAFVGTGLTVRDRNYKIPYVYQFQAGFQYELPFKSTLEVSYVGSRTHRFAISRSLNYIPLAQRLSGVANPSYLTQAVPNPFFGAAQLTGTSIASSTITMSQSLLPFPQFTSVTQTAVPAGNSWYNALELRLNKRFSQGLTVTLVYTFAKAMEATSYREPQYTFLERTLSNWDRTHNLGIAASYDIPVGKGKRFGTNFGRVLDGVAGNWQYNVQVRYLNGTPLGMPNAIPARDPRLRGADQSLGHYFSTCTLLTNSTRSNCTSPDEPITWVQLAPNQLITYSSLSPNMRSPAVPRTNMSLFKIVPIKERLRLEFRVAAYNAMNNKIYGSPSTTLTGATFGQVALGSQANGARVGELALRLLW